MLNCNQAVLHSGHPAVVIPRKNFLQEILLETQDAELLHEGEEVTLMDWGNAIIKVQAILP